MTIAELVKAIAEKHKAQGIKVYKPATEEEIWKFEQRVGFKLPDDFREFYTICNGFECDEDQFVMASLSDITHYDRLYGPGWFSFADYLVRCDFWEMEIRPMGNYVISNNMLSEPLTTSLHEFLSRFLQGNVFDPGGLYDWHDEIKKKQS